MGWKRESEGGSKLVPLLMTKEPIPTTHARKLCPALVKVAARHYAVAARKQSCSVLASAAALWTKKFPARTNAISEQNSEV
jgi:hypothetical protein